MKIVPMFLLLISSQIAFAMQPIDDEQLSEILGREGVAVELELRVNTDANGNPLNSMTNCGSGAGPFFTSECRLGLQFEGFVNEWLVLRGVYGFMKIDRLTLDASLAGNSNSFGHFDASKFQDVNGVCLLNGGCTQANVLNQPAMAVSYPATTPAYSAGTSTGYDSFLLGFTVKEVEIISGADSYLDGLAGLDPNGITDANGSFLGLSIGDDSGSFATNSAGFAIGGTAYVMGF